MSFNKTAYDKLIRPDGQPQYGCFTQSMKEINHADFDYRTVMDRPASRLQKHFGLNQFQFLTVQSDRYVLACAIADVRYAATAFIYLFDSESRTMSTQRFTQPMGLRCQLSNQPHNGRSYFIKGRNQFEIIATDAPNQYHLTARLNKQIAVDLVLTQPEQLQPLAVCTRAGYNGWAFTEKLTGLTASGVIAWGGRNITVESDNFLGSSDWSCGYMRRETAWNWASLCGTDNAGRTVGLNLAAGVNETEYNENGFWIDGKLNRVGPAIFQFNRFNRMQPWTITTENSQVDLKFIPEGNFNEKVNAVFVAFNFSQLPGKYSGTLTCDSGKKIVLQRVTGLAEDHYAKW